MQLILQLMVNCGGTKDILFGEENLLIIYWVYSKLTLLSSYIQNTQFFKNQISKCLYSIQWL